MKNMISKKSIISLLLVFCMVLGMMPVNAFAAEGEVTESIIEADDTLKAIGVTGLKITNLEFKGSGVWTHTSANNISLKFFYVGTAKPTFEILVTDGVTISSGSGTPGMWSGKMTLRPRINNKSYTITIQGIAACQNQESENHTYAFETVTKPASCYEPGKKTQTCTCGYTNVDVEIPATNNHTWATEGTVTKTPTCMSPGTETFKCTTVGCTAVDERTLTVEHTWDAGVVQTPAVADQLGEMLYTCTFKDADNNPCGATKTEPIKPLGYIELEDDVNFSEIIIKDVTVTSREVKADDEGVTIEVVLDKETEKDATAQVQVAAKTSVIIEGEPDYATFKMTTMMNDGAVSQYGMAPAKLVDGKVTFAFSEAGSGKLYIINFSIEPDKEAAINEISNYVSLEDYREADAAEIEMIIAVAKDAIDKAKTQEEVNEIVENTKKAIGEFKTDEELTVIEKTCNIALEGDPNVSEIVIKDVKVKSYEVTMDDVEVIVDVVLHKDTAADATAQIQANIKRYGFVNPISGYATFAGQTGTGGGLTVYGRGPAKLVDGKITFAFSVSTSKADKTYIINFKGVNDAAKDEIGDFVDLNDYRETEVAEIKKIIEEAKVVIDKATTEEEIEEAVKAAKEAIGNIKTDVQLKAEEETNKPVETPTDKPVETPTDKPVETPTDKPVETPTDKPVVPTQLKTPEKVKSSNVAKTGKVKVTWNKVEGAEKYEVYRATSKNGKYKLVKTVTGTSYTDSSTKAGKVFYYKVKAVSADKNVTASEYSKAVKGTVDLKMPVVTAKSKTKKQVKLAWKKVSSAKKYEIYRATSKNGKYKKIATTTKLSYTNKKLKSGKTYYYKVKAIAKKKVANSAFSKVDKCKSK